MLTGTPKILRSGPGHYQDMLGWWYQFLSIYFEAKILNVCEKKCGNGNRCVNFTSTIGSWGNSRNETNILAVLVSLDTARNMLRALSMASSELVYTANLVCDYCFMNPM